MFLDASDDTNVWSMEISTKDINVYVTTCTIDTLRF